LVTFWIIEATLSFMAQLLGSKRSRSSAADAPSPGMRISVALLADQPLHDRPRPAPAVLASRELLSFAKVK
jgi:hypothetical protein